jgi:hypothetical protein
VNRQFAAALLATVCASPLPTLADSFRCGNYLVTEGMTAAAIEERCGKPQRVEHVEEPIRARRANGSSYRVGTAVHEFWTYERAPGQFPARVRIEDGKAKKIELITER